MANTSPHQYAIKMVALMQSLHDEETTMNELETFNQIGAALTGNLRQLQLAQALPPAPSSLLLTARQGADLLGVSLRMFHGMRALLPKPVVLGPRCVRWRREDLLQYVQTLQAATEPRPEPQQLRAGRDKRKGSGGQMAGCVGEPALTQAEPRVGRTLVPSSR